MRNAKWISGALLSVLSGIGMAEGVVLGEGFSRPEFELTPLSGFEPLTSLSLAGAGAVPVPFRITINFSGDAAFESAFNDAAAAFEALIPSYLDGRFASFFSFGGLTIDASVEAIDGVGGTLGQAGPVDGRRDDSGYLMATTGVMEFDSADFSTPTGSFSSVVLHEMAHVIGIGTLWDDNGLYDPDATAVVDPNNSESVGRYLGANGLAGGQSDYDVDADYVPVEKGGSPGNADGHWNEGENGAATGYISAVTGKDSRYELMTGWLNPGSEFSNATLGSLRDLGYDVAFVPESSTWMLGMLGCLGLLIRRRR